MIAILLVALFAAAPASAPTTSIALEDMQSLADGAVRYVAPQGWQFVQKNDDGMGVRYALPDGAGVIDVVVTVQNQMIQESARPQMANLMSKGIREAAEKAGHELLFPPHLEPDPRFFLRFRDAQRVEGRIADRVQMYRSMGVYFIHLAATARVDAVDESQGIHDTAAKMLEGMKLGRSGKPSAFKRTQIKVIIPADWKEARTDQPNGLVATYTHPKDPLRQIIVRARIIPRDARNGPKQDALLEKMVDEERALPPLTKDSADQEEKLDPGKSLRRIRTFGKRGDQDVAVETRYLVVGDILVSVRSICTDGDLEETSKLAGKFAEQIKPTRE